MFKPERFPMIRAANVNDAPKIAVHLINAMKELVVQYVNDSNPYNAIPLFELFAAKENNQYSYQNMLVYCLDEKVVGVINGYDGKRFSDLRAPFISYLRDELHVEISLEAETAEGEYYIDALSVDEHYRGKGIGKNLMLKLIEKAQNEGFEKIGLLVSKEKDVAKGIYESLGFNIIDMKRLIGETYYHMQLIP